ncbi:MAG: hypothetical protein GF398_06795 [Chitinivibrionales bacterium]|nr:hypothetical protein [Chitinivibrionales bacterium]
MKLLTLSVLVTGVLFAINSDSSAAIDEHADEWHIPGKGRAVRLYAGKTPTHYYRLKADAAAGRELMRQKEKEVNANFAYWVDYLKKHKHDPGLVREALYRLGYARGKNAPKAIALMKQVIARDEYDMTARTSAVSTLSSLLHGCDLDDAVVLDNIYYLKKLLEHDAVAVRMQVAVVLMSFGEAAANREVLLSAYDNPEFRSCRKCLACKGCVAQSIATIGGERAREALYRAMAYGDLDAEIKIAIAKAIVSLGNESRGIRHLKNILKKAPDKRSRAKALYALAPYVQRQDVSSFLQEVRDEHNEKLLRITAGRILQKECPDCL